MNNQYLFDPSFVRTSPHLSLDLLTGNCAALLSRIETAKSNGDHVRRSLQAAAERRNAKHAGLPEVTVRLYGWPVIITYEGHTATMRQETQVYTKSEPRMALLASKFLKLWGNHFAGSGAAEVLPLPSAVHLNAILDGDPMAISRCVFNGASILEGRKPAEFKFYEPENPILEAASDAVSAPYLLLAYVATPSSHPDPVPKLHPSDKLAAEQLISAIMALSGHRPPRVSVFNPQGYFQALDTLQLEHQWAFAQWAEQRGMNPTFASEEVLSPAGIHRQITARHHGAGTGHPQQYTWRFDRTWRPADTQASILESLENRMRRLRSPPGYFPGAGTSAYSSVSH